MLGHMTKERAEELRAARLAESPELRITVRYCDGTLIHRSDIKMPAYYFLEIRQPDGATELVL